LVVLRKRWRFLRTILRINGVVKGTRDGLTRDGGRSDPSEYVAGNTASESCLLNAYISSNSSFSRAFVAAISERSVSSDCLRLRNEKKDERFELKRTIGNIPRAFFLKGC